MSNAADRRGTHSANTHSAGATILLTIGLSLSGCQQAPEKAPEPPAAAAPAPAPAPVVKNPPRISIDESGPTVRGMSALLVQPGGAENAAGLEKLRQYLADEKEFIAEKDVQVTVDRKAIPLQVAAVLREIGALGAAKIIVETSTRNDYPGKLPFVAPAAWGEPDPCTLVGTITQDRGTAIGRIRGGQARKRSRGMGGPDLSMTALTIADMTKKCDSDLFFATAVEGVEWGLVYDLAASALSLEGAGLERAAVPLELWTAGHPVRLTP